MITMKILTCVRIDLHLRVKVLPHFNSHVFKTVSNKIKRL